MVPWQGDDFAELLITGCPVVYFDGVAHPRFGTAAAYMPPGHAVATMLPRGAVRQAELAAAPLAYRFSLPQILLVEHKMWLL